MIDPNISHYKIVEKIGKGGMGVVYKAIDTRLQRTVAIKVLPPEFASDEKRKRRLITEAQAASALNHSNICHIYEIDEANDNLFIVMEYVDGRTLQQMMANGTIPQTDVIEIAVQVADALAKTHRRNVVHRDIKPSNIVVTEDGQVKILDFGLARILRPLSDKTPSEATTSLMSLTESGAVAGTISYMSPEQLRGKEVDGRSDMFSFGVVLYEMLAGSSPFQGETAFEVASAILKEDPPSLEKANPDIDRHLAQIIHRALQRNSDDRFSSMQEMLEELKQVRRQSSAEMLVYRSHTPVWIRRTVLLGILLLFIVLGARELIQTDDVQSIAVLPFANVDNNRNAEYLADGISESITNNLTNLSFMRVMAYNTMMRYKSRDIDAMSVGRQLHVESVLTGSVRQQQDELIVSAELIDVSSGRSMWGQQYNRKMGDLLTIQEDISSEIVENLHVRLTGNAERSFAKQYTSNSEAYNLYLHGRYWWNKRSGESLRKAIPYFEQAIAKDPSYALAYAGLADCYALLGGYSIEAPQASFQKAKEAALKALSIDDELGEAHTSLGQISTYYWDFRTADREFQRGIQLKPGYATAHHWYATFLAAMGRQPEALAQIRKALELDPLSLSINEALGWQLYLARRYDQAIAQYVKTLELDPNFVPAHSALAMAYVQKGMFEQAIREFKRAVQLSGGNTDYKAELAYGLVVAGKTVEAKNVLQELLDGNEYVSPVYIARIYTGLGDTDTAIKYLQRAYDEHAEFLTFVKVEPTFQPLHGDPRFRKLLSQIGLT